MHLRRHNYVETEDTDMRHQVTRPGAWRHRRRLPGTRSGALVGPWSRLTQAHFDAPQLVYLRCIMSRRCCGHFVVPSGAKDIESPTITPVLQTSDKNSILASSQTHKMCREWWLTQRRTYWWGSASDEKSSKVWPSRHNDAIAYVETFAYPRVPSVSFKVCFPPKTQLLQTHVLCGSILRKCQVLQRQITLDRL